jgi:hypothetical protein
VRSENRPEKKKKVVWMKWVEGRGKGGVEITDGKAKKRKI